MGPFDFSDHALLHEVDQSAVGCSAVVLVSHLGGHPGPGGGFSHLARFMNRAGQRLLRVTADSLLEGGHGDRRVHVIRSRDGDAIQVFLLLQHDPPVGVATGLGPLPGCGGDPSALASLRPLHVAEGHDVTVLGGTVGVDPSLAAHAHCREIGGLVRGTLGPDATGEQGGGRGGGEAPEEGAARHSVHRRRFSVVFPVGKNWHLDRILLWEWRGTGISPFQVPC